MVIFFKFQNKTIQTKINPNSNCKKDRLKKRILDFILEKMILKTTKYQLLRNVILKSPIFR